MGSPGRSDATYKATAKRFQAGDYPCHMCGTAPGVTVDHVPPLSSAPHPHQWQGRLLPACAHCNYAAGAAIANERMGRTPAKPRTTRHW